MTLTDFFHGEDTKLGVFYPTGCLIAVYPDADAARSAVQRLRNAGFAQDDAIAVSGREMIRHDQKETGIGSMLMQSISRFFATEQIFNDQDLEQAREGAAFVVVRCDTDQRKQDAWDVLKRDVPRDARYYASSGVEHLAGDPKTD